MAGPDALQALGLGPLMLAATLLRPPGLSGLPPALAELAGDPAARLDALIARVAAPPGQETGDPEEAQRHAPVTAPVSNGRLSQSDVATAPAPTQAFAQSPLLGLLPARRPGNAAAPPAPSHDLDTRLPELPAQAATHHYLPQILGQAPSANGRAPLVAQPHPAHIPPSSAAPLWPSPARNGDAPRASQATSDDAVLPKPSPAPGAGPATDDGQQPGELRLVRGLNQLHSLLNASVRPDAAAPTRPAEDARPAASPSPVFGQLDAAPAPAAAPLPQQPPLSASASTRSDSIGVGDALALSDAEPAQPLDVERLLDELAERLEIEYLRTYGTSG